MDLFSKEHQKNETIFGKIFLALFVTQVWELFENCVKIKDFFMPISTDGEENIHFFKQIFREYLIVMKIFYKCLFFKKKISSGFIT
jgi:hypothetical protein